MPKLTIDDYEVEVPAGTKVIEAAEMLGIVIPRFCYLEALGAIGACRMCAVKFLHGPFRGIQMSCMVDAQDGMVVSTTDEEAVAFRKRIIELLMINHPHDCPVCDEGGQCLLQDVTVSSGHGIRRYPGYKRTYRNQYLGIFINHEMNRCIHCYRCSRFYQEYSGYDDLGAMQIGSRVYFGRFKEGQLDSPYSGNLVDICPVGVYTDKTAQYKVRRWDLERSPSLCIHCSLGCNTIANARYRATVRVEARFSRPVNGYFICDRGRFSFSYSNGGKQYTQRPWRARIGLQESAWGAAIEAAAEKLSVISKTSGPKSIACIGSPRSSLETLAELKRACRLLGWREPSFFLDSSVQRKVHSAVSRLDERIAISLREIEGADFVLAVGVDPMNEAPMLALSVRQAARKGATVAVIDPRPVELPMSFEHVPAGPGFIEACMSAVIRGALRREENAGGDESPAGSELEALGMEQAIGVSISDLAQKLRDAGKPVIICGTDIVRETTPDIAADHALSLHERKGRAGLFYVLPGANAFSGAMLTSSDGNSFSDIVEAIENGTVKALVVVESDPLRYYPDRDRLDKVLKKLDLLIVLDYLKSDIAQGAHILFPTTTHFETGSSFINQEGRLQFAHPVHMPGIPLYGGHPTKLFENYVPGGDPKAAWLVLSDLLRALSKTEKGAVIEPYRVELKSDEPIPRTEAFIPGKGWPLGPVWQTMSEEIPALSELSPEEYPFDNVRVLPVETRTITPRSGKAQLEEAPVEGSIELLLVDWMFGSEELSAYADAVQPIVREPCLYMHSSDAAGAGISNGDMVRLHLHRSSLDLTVVVTEKMARAVAILPRHWKLAWQKIEATPVIIPPGGIERV